MKQAHLGVAAALAGGLIWIAGPAWAQHQHPAPAPRQHAPEQQTAKGEEALKVGKKGEIHFRVETAVGDVKLKPGHYQMQHRVADSGHFVHFTEVTEGQLDSNIRSGVPKTHPGDVPCRLEPLTKKASQTMVHTSKQADGARVTRVVIQGENVAHIF